MKFKILLAMFFIFTLQACLVQEVTKSEKPKECPTWSNFTDRICDVELVKAEIGYSDREIELNEDKKIWLSFINGELLINTDDVGLVVISEDGETFDYVNNRLFDGIYIISADEGTQPVFFLKNPGSGFVTIAMEVVEKTE